MTIQPSRLLNEKVNFLGLTILDMCFLGYLLISSNALLEKISLELLSFPIVILAALFLIQIRLKHRPKTIRDCFKQKTLWKFQSLNRGTSGGGVLKKGGSGGGNVIPVGKSSFERPRINHFGGVL